MIRDKSKKVRPDIRVITRLVPPRGNLVQGQSELAIHPHLANAAAEVINANQNHYSPAEGVSELREAVAQKINLLNGLTVDAKATPPELLITPGATGGLIAIAQTYLKNSAAIVFEPYYPYHGRILEELGGQAEVLQLHGENLDLDGEELRARCHALINRQPYPLRAIIVCTPVNPTGKVFTSQELEIVRNVCQEFDLLCIADEVYEHYVEDANNHVSIATLGGMRERTITVNSFSKSWNISGWRLGYVYGDSKLVAPLNSANNIFYVCSPTPLQRALAKTLMADPQYYSNLRGRFARKRIDATEVLEQLGFEIYDSGSTFYIWARIPKGYTNAIEFNEMLMSRARVAGVPGSAFADSDEFDDYMRFCIAREDDVLESALGKIRKAISG